MEAQKTKLHPLVAGAAAAVIVAAGVAVAAITGVLPGSKAEIAPTPVQDDEHTSGYDRGCTPKRDGNTPIDCRAL